MSLANAEVLRVTKYHLSMSNVIHRLPVDMDMAASGTRINAQIPVIPNTKCQLCDKNNIKWKCFNCDEFMCDQCKKVHLKGKATGDHKLTSVYESDDSEGQLTQEQNHVFEENKVQRMQEQNSGSDASEEQQTQEQNQMKRCSSHPTEEVILFCQDCKSFICKNCVVLMSHKTHCIRKMEERIDEKRKEISKIMDDMFAKLSSLEGTNAAIKKMYADFCAGSDKCIEAVESKNTLLKSELDKITENAIKKIQLNVNGVGEKVKEKETELEYANKELKEMTDRCQELKTRGGIELVQLVKDMKMKFEQYELEQLVKNVNVFAPNTFASPKFVTSEISEQKLEALFGEIQLYHNEDTIQTPSKSPEDDTQYPLLEKNKDVKVLYHRKTSSSSAAIPVNDGILSFFTMMDINRVAAINNTRAWVAEFESNKIILVTMDGEIVYNVKTDIKICDLAVNKTGELHVTGTGSQGLKVMKLTSDRMFVNLYTDPDNCNTSAISVTDDDDIVVGLNDLQRGKIVKFNSSGELTSTIETPFFQRLINKTPLFDKIYSISHNINGDIIIVQWNDEVVGLNKDHDKRFKYTGKVRGLEKPFCPRYSVTDKHGHILISDSDNSCIHMLDMNGKFISFIMTEQHGIQAPLGLSIDDKGNLWVCSTGNDKIMVVKYI